MIEVRHHPLSCRCFLLYGSYYTVHLIRFLALLGGFMAMQLNSLGTMYITSSLFHSDYLVWLPPEVGSGLLAAADLDLMSLWLVVNHIYCFDFHSARGVFSSGSKFSYWLTECATCDPNNVLALSVSTVMHSSKYLASIRNGRSPRSWSTHSLMSIFTYTRDGYARNICKPRASFISW